MKGRKILLFNYLILYAGWNCAYRHTFACADNLEEVEPRTSDSFLPRTFCNLKEVELCLTAGGSPKGNTCGLPHPRSLISTSKGSNHAYSAKKNRSSISIPFFRMSLSNSSRKSNRLWCSLWFMMYCVTASFPDIETVAAKYDFPHPSNFGNLSAFERMNAPAESFRSCMKDDRESEAGNCTSMCTWSSMPPIRYRTALFSLTNPQM